MTKNKAHCTLDQAKKGVGEGWHTLLDALFALKPETTNVRQVKEKLGGLRFYVDGTSTDAFRAMIRFAETLSYSLCKECGRPGELRACAWLKTLCDACYEKKR